MPPPVHILTHEFHPFTGGIATYIEETARAAAESGLPVTVWAPGEATGDNERFPFTVRRVRMRGKQDWLCRWRLARALKQAFPAATIEGTLVLAEPGPIRLWMYQSLLNLPRPDRLVIILHGSEIMGLSRNPWRRAALRRLLAASDCIGCVSGPVMELVRRLAPETGKRLVRVPGAVRSAWSELPPRRREERAVGDILHVGRIHPRKGQLELVEAVGRLPASIRETVRVRLIGPTGRPAYLRRIEARATALSVNLQLDGRLPGDQLREAYETAALLTLPSQPYGNSVEGLGLSLLEAQHFGCPVLGSRIGGVPEAMLEGKSGLLVPPADVSALADGLAAVLSDPARAADMGLKGSEFVRANFSWHKNLQEMELA